MSRNAILHIANSYGGTAVYYNLYSELDKLCVPQQIFVPLNARNANRVGSHQIHFMTKDSSLFYSTSLKWYHKYAYSLKIKKILSSIENTGIDLTKIKCIHASTFCLDGAVANLLWEKFRTPYFVTIRDTDVNAYYKKLWWYRPFFHKILLNASKVFFISPSYKNRLLSEVFPESIRDRIKDKIVTIPNGIDRVFLENRFNRSKLENKPIKIVYAGAIQKRKNPHSTIRAISLLRKQGFDISFTLIGKGLEYRRLEAGYEKSIEKEARFHDWIHISKSCSKTLLKDVLRNYDIFVMPSKTETFGLVYIEALSQGLPIIYSKGQGFDGLFDDGEVGYGVNANSVSDIADKIKMVIRNYECLAKNISELDFGQFDWVNIAAQYESIYESI